MPPLYHPIRRRKRRAKRAVGVGTGQLAAFLLYVGALYFALHAVGIW